MQPVERAEFEGIDYGWVMQTTFVVTIVVGAPVVAVLSAFVTLDSWGARAAFAVRVGAPIWFLTAVAVALYARRTDAGDGGVTRDDADAAEGGVAGDDEVAAEGGVAGDDEVAAEGGVAGDDEVAAEGGVAGDDEGGVARRDEDDGDAAEDDGRDRASEGAGS